MVTDAQGQTATATIVVNIIDVKPTVSITAGDPNASESGPDNGSFTFTRSGSTADPLTVIYSLYGTATNGVDYQSLSGSVTLTSGQTSVTILVVPIQDSQTIEGSETVVLSLGDNKTYVYDHMSSTATVTIADDSSGPVVSLIASDSNASEVGPDNGAFTISRNGPTTDALTIYYFLSGTATNKVDYSELAGAVTIPAGQASASITITPVQDSVNSEGNETVVLTLSSSKWYQFDAESSSATVTIADNTSSSLPVVSLSASDANASEVGPDNGEFTITRSGSTADSLTVYYSTAGTASNKFDYSELSGYVTIPAGKSMTTISVIPFQDSLNTEGTETVVLNLQWSKWYDLDGMNNIATVAIADNPSSGLPVVSITATDANAGENGPDTGVFTVTRTGSTSAALMLNYAISGTASNKFDYSELWGSMTIPAGAQSATITITPVQDQLNSEGNETVIVTLVSSNGIYDVDSNGGSGAITIVDNPIVPVFSPSSYEFSVHENVTPGTVVGTVTATEGSYSLTYSGSGGPFTIQSNGTVVYWGPGPLNYESLANPTIAFVATATDAYGSTATANVQVHVLDDNEKPTLDYIQNYNLYVGETLMLTPGGHDPDVESTLTYSASAGPGQLWMEGHSEWFSEAQLDNNGVPEGSFRILPHANSAGQTYQVSITVRDQGGLTDIRSFYVTVAPIIPAQIVSPGTELYINENTYPWSINISGTLAQSVFEPFGQWSSSLTSLNDWQNYGGINVQYNSDTHGLRIDYAGGEKDGGSTWQVPVYYQTVVRYQRHLNNDEGYDEEVVNVVATTLTFHIVDTNYFPSPNISQDVSLLAGTDLVLPLLADDYDSPRQQIGFSVEPLPWFLTASGMQVRSVVNSEGPADYGYEWSWTRATAELYWPASANKVPGQYAIRVDSTDSYGATSSTFVQINVYNHLPQLSVGGSRVTAQDVTLDITSFVATDTDVPLQTLIWSLDANSLARGMTIDPQTGHFSWLPGVSTAPGNYAVTVTVTDGVALVTGTFDIQVIPVNSTPALVLPNQVARVGEELRVPLHATDADALNIWTYQLAGALLPGMQSEYIGNEWALVWTPGPEFSNTNVHAAVTVTDNGLPNKSATAPFEIHVQPPNRTPWVTGDINPMAYAGVAYSSTLMARDSDEGDEQHLSVSVVSGPAGLTATITPPPVNNPSQHATLSLDWIPSTATIGTIVPVTLRVTDAHGASYDVPTLHIAVQPAPANHAPVLSFDPPLNYNVPWPPTDPATQIYYLGRGESKQVELSFTLPPELLPKSDIVFLVDDSGSMDTELDWISHINTQTGQFEGMVPELSDKLEELGLNDNQFTVLSFREVASYLAAHDRGYSVTVLGLNGEVVSRKSVDSHDWGAILTGARYPDPILSDFVLPNDGDYRVVIDDYQLGQDPALGTGNLSYHFTLDNTPTIVHQATLPWETIVRGSIDGPGHVVDYPITVSHAGYYYLDSLSNRSDLGWTLTRPNGSVVAARTFADTERDTIIVPDNPYDLNDHEQVTYVPTKTLWLDPGTYDLRVAGLKFAAEGAYSLRWMDLSAAPTVAWNTATLAKLRPGNGTAAFTIDTVAGDQLALSVANGDAPEFADVHLRLIDPLGRPVLDQAVSPDTTNYTTRLAGTYTLLFEGAITALRPATYLSFTVSHQLYSPPSFTTATEMTWGSSISLTSGQTQIRKFHLDEQMPLWLDAMPSMPNDVTWNLRGPSGVLIATSAVATNYGFTGAFQDVLPAGDYYFEFRNSNSASQSLIVNKREIASHDEPLAGGETVTLTTSWTEKVIPLEVTAGQKYAVSLATTGGAYSPQWTIVSPTGEVQPPSTNWGPGMMDSVWPAWTPEVSGTWLLVSQGGTIPSGGALTLGLVAVIDTKTDLTLNAVAHGTFSGPNQIQNYDIDLTESGLLAFDSLSNRSDLHWTLSDASGVVIGARTFTTSDGNDLAYGRSRAQIFSPGHYTLSISSTSGVAGSYDFVVRNLLTTTDALTDAAPVLGTLTDANELRVWRWTPDVDIGSVVTLHLDDWTSSTAANVRVIDSFGRQWISTDLSDNGQAQFTLPYQTDFFVLLEGDIYNWTAQKQYALSLSTAEGTTTPPTATLATLGSVISGAFSSGNSTACYEFLDMAAGTYFVDGIQALTTNWYNGQPAIGSIEWQAQSATGIVLAQGTWGGSGGMPGMGGNYSNPDDRPSANGLLIVPAGTYRIQLQSYVNGTLSYQFKVSAVTPSAMTPGDISGQLSSGTQARVYHFSGTAGQHFRLEVDPWGTADEIAQRADRLYPVSGNAEEDGVTAILKALQGLNFRAGSSRQIVLVTDESRAIQDSTATTSRLLTELKKLRVTLHSVLNNPLRADLPGDGVPDLAHDFTDVIYQPNIFAPFRFEVVGASMGDVNLGLPHGSTLLGVDAHGGSFRILPNGGIEPGAPTTISTLDDLIDAAYRDDWANILDFVNTSEDLAVLAAAMNFFDDYSATINSQYADPALATGGSVWDLNQLRKEPYNVSLNDGGPGPEHPATQVHYDPAKSFSNAFAQMIQRAVAESLPLSLISSTNTAPYQILSTSYANGVVTFNVEFQGDGHNYNFGLQVVNTDTGVVSDSLPFQLIATYVAQPQATDADGDPLTYSLVGDAHGATIDSQTGSFHWDPVGLDVADGNYSFTVEVSDGRGGTDRKTWSVTVGPAENNNRLPYGTGRVVITASIDEQVSIDVGNVVGDSDGDPLTFTIDASQLSDPLPDGWKLNRLTGVMTWTPTYDYLRQDAYEFPVLISDGRGGTVTQIVQIQVVDSDVFTNAEPSVSFNLPAEFRSFSSYVLPVSAYDPNGDALGYTIVTMPDGMAWDAQQHRFSWRPTEDQVGQHYVLFRVSDGQGGTASVSRVLNVLSSNQLPVFDSDVADAGPAYSGQTWTYHSHATDPDGDLNLIYSIDEDAKAQGAKINPATGELTWFFSDESEHVVTIIVTDTWGGRDGQIVHIPVNPPPQPNAAPVFLSEPVSVATAGEEYRWTIDVADPDYDALTFGLDAESRRRGMTIQDGTLVWAEPVKGRYSVSLMSWDDHDGATTLSFTLKVTAQHPPEIRNQPSTKAYVGQPWVYSIYAVDPDEERVSLSLNSEPSGMAFDANDHTLLRWTPTATGTVTFDIVATDERGAQTTKTVELNVSTWDPNAPEQVAPEFLSQPIGPGYVGTEWSYVVLARDLNQDDMTFELVSGPAGHNGMRLEELTPEELDDLNLPEGVAAKILRWTAPISGNFWVELKVSDGTELSATQGFELPIAKQNSPPRDLSGAFDDLYIGLPWQYQILPYDPDGDVVTVATVEIRQGNSPISGAEIDSQNRVTWTPTSAGEYALHLVLVDGRGGEYETDITLHVHDAQAEIASWGNPKVVSVPMNPPIAGQPWGFQLIAVDASTPPKDMRVVLRPGSTLPHGLHVEEDGRIWWEVVPYDASDFSALELRIYDKDNRQTDYTLPMRIITNNLRPEFDSALAVPPAHVGETWSWDLIVNDPDPDNPAVLNVVLDAESEAAGVYVDSTLQGPDGKWHVTLKWDSPTSSRPITVTVYDRDIELSEGTENVDKLPPVATATVGFVLHLNDQSEGLRIVSAPTTTFAAVGKLWQYTPHFTFDGSATAATLDYSSDIIGLTLDETTGTFTWTPSLLTNGMLTITATGGDSAQTVVQTLVLSSYAPYRLNEAPEFTSTGLPGKIERDRAYMAIIQATDANGDVLRYSLDNAAIDAGMSINSRTGVLTWTPHVSGNVSFTVTVSDGELSTAQSYQLRVDPNAAPEITSLPITVYQLRDPAYENVSLDYCYAVFVDEPNAYDTLT